MHEGYKISVLIKPVEPCNHLIVEGSSSLKQKSSWIFLQTISHLISLAPSLHLSLKASAKWDESSTHSFRKLRTADAVNEACEGETESEFINKYYNIFLQRPHIYRIIRFIHEPPAERYFNIFSENHCYINSQVQSTTLMILRMICTNVLLLINEEH